MNLAFPALLIILYILPGVAFANGLLKPIRRLAGSRSIDWSTQIAYGALLALPIHWMALAIADHLPFHFTPNLSDALVLLDDKDTAANTGIIQSACAHSGQASVYFSVITFVAYLGGLLAGFFLSEQKKIGFFFARPQWDDRLTAKTGFGLFVEVVVERASNSYLYVGLFVDKMVDEKGVLRGIWLSDARRRNLLADNPANPELEVFYPIDMDVLFIAMDKVQTLSCSYFEIPSVDEDEHKEEIESIAHSLWQERNGKPDDTESKELDWKRAKLLFEFRLKNSRGWRKAVTFLAGVRDYRAREEEKIKKMQLKEKPLEA